MMQDEQQLKKVKLSTYRTKFNNLKADFLHYKWVLDMNLEDAGSKDIRKRMEKISTLLFEIESDFVKDVENSGKKKKYK